MLLSCYPQLVLIIEAGIYGHLADSGFTASPVTLLSIYVSLHHGANSGFSSGHSAIAQGVIPTSIELMT